MVTAQRFGDTAAYDDGEMDWLLLTLNRLLQCRDVAALLDMAYDAIHHGLGYDRVGLFLVDAERRVLVQHIGTDEDGNKFYPTDRLSRLDDASYHARLLADPRMNAAGPGFVYLADATLELPSDLRERLDGRPGQNLQVALRTAEAVRGMIAVDNLTSGRTITPAHAPPLVAFATALTMALENVALLEHRTRQIATLDADLHRRLAELTWLQEAGDRLARLHGLEDVLATIYDCIRTGLGYDRVGILLAEPAADGRVAWQDVRGTDEQGRCTPGLPGSFVLDAAELQRRPDLRHLIAGHPSFYCADRWALTPPRDRHVLTKHLREQAVIALRHDDDLVGCVWVDNLLTERPIAPEDAAPLVAFAPQAALAISRARLWAAHEAQGQRLARRVAELEWLREIGQRVNGAATLDDVLDVVYAGIHDGLGYDRVGIQLIDQALGILEERRGTSRAGVKTCPTDRMFPFTATEPILRWQGLGVLLQGAAFYYTANSYAETPEELRYLCDGRPAHTLVVPLRSGAALIGTISVDNMISGRPIGPRDAGPLQALAHQVATALENARLLERERAERAAAEAAVRVRDDFLTAASHDLRTPLTSVLGYADLMLMRLQSAQPIPTGWIEARVGSLRAAAQRMIATVEEITDAAQLQIGGQLALQVEAVELSQVLAVAIEIVTQAAPAGAAAVRCDAAPGLRVPGDRARLERVMQNVIGNAVKYSPAATPVHVAVRARKSWVAITVRDRGVGIPADELGYVFTHFYRASTSIGIKGTGVGLAGSRTIVEQHGGSITLKSAVGRGTAVTIRLPRSEVSPRTTRGQLAG